MTDEFISGIIQYGYLAVFLLIFLQEIGFPSPIPNEFVLLFSGYLSYNGIISAPLAILTAIAGDLLAGTILFLLFYFFRKFIRRLKPKWLPHPTKKLERISKQINEKGTSGIFIGRLTPFIRGYVAVLCGLLRVTPLKYSSALFLSSISWATCYVCIGYFIGPYQHLFLSSDKNLQILLILVPLIIILLFFLFQFIKKIFPISKQ